MTCFLHMHTNYSNTDAVYHLVTDEFLGDRVVGVATTMMSLEFCVLRSPRMHTESDKKQIEPLKTLLRQVGKLHSPLQIVASLEKPA